VQLKNIFLGMEKSYGYKGFPKNYAQEKRL